MAPSRNPPAAATPTTDPLPTTPASIETEILRIHTYLLSLHGALSPAPKTNSALTRLITLLTAPHLDDPVLRRTLLASPALAAITPSLRTLCADAEYQLELHWATRIAASPDPWRTLAAFPYLDNYHALTRLERHALLALGAPAALPWVVLGSGPLPLSAVALAVQEPGVDVTCVEVCAAAAGVSREVVRALGLAGRVKVVCAEAGEWMREAGGGGVTMVASLLRGKEAVLGCVRADGWVLVRSARGVRRLVYERVEVAEVVAAGCRVVGRVEPYECDGGVVNSVVVARGPARV